MARMAVEVSGHVVQPLHGAQGTDLGDGAHHQALAFGEPVDGLGTGGLVDAVALLAVHGGIEMDPGYAIGAAVVRHHAAETGAVVIRGYRGTLRELEFHHVTRHRRSRTISAVRTMQA